LEIKNQVMLKKIINAIRVLFKSSSNKSSKRPHLHLQEEWNSKGNPFLILSISIPMILVVLIH